jgi:hypothetical protein
MYYAGVSDKACWTEDRRRGTEVCGREHQPAFITKLIFCIPTP